MTEKFSTTEKVSKQELAKLKTFFIDYAPTCVHKAEGLLKYRYTTPTYAVKAGSDDHAAVPERSLTGHYLQMYDWDACFFAQAAQLTGLDALSGLGIDVVANFLSLKEANGQIPRTISPQRIWDQGDQCKPFLAQTLWVEFMRAGESAKEQIGHYLDDLDCYLKFFQRERKKQFGLYHWRNVLESGVDDNLALIAPREAAKDEDESVGKFPDGAILATDLSSYLAREFLCFADFCAHFKRPQLEAEYRAEAKALIAAIEEKLWNDKLSMYCNYNPLDKNAVELRSWTGMAPVLMDLASEEHRERVIKDNILNPDHFLRAHGLASHAVSEPLANQQRRGLYGRAIVSNWQGPVWVLPNAMAVRILNKYGYKEEAREISARVVNTLLGSLSSNNTLFENYDADTGKGLWAPQFMSWNILALELVQTLE
ncbi:MAG: trehalase family glycosidase [Candidatus Obscuribacterales bacterium]|jgi:hypothetical protein